MMLHTVCGICYLDADFIVYCVLLRFDLVGLFGGLYWLAFGVVCFAFSCLIVISLAEYGVDSLV